MKEKICDRIVNDLLMEINKGLLKPKEKLPTNQELAKKYHTSVVTVRKSIGILINKGYLMSIERVGIFVKEREKDLFYINFAVEGNINEEITNTVIEDIHMTITRDKEKRKDIKTLEIKKIYYSESMPIGYSIDALFLGGHYNADDIIEKTEKKIMQMMMIFNGFDVKKTLKITMDYPNRYIAQRLFIDESIPIFCFVVNVETLENQPIGKRTFYIAAENIDLKGKSFYD
jgi:GntR family transcriptional regulator